MRHPKFILGLVCLLGVAWDVSFAAASSDEEDLRYKVVDTNGKVTAYRDETDETTRLRIGEFVDEGDTITTGPKSEAVLRLKGRAYAHLAPNTKVHISRLKHIESKSLESRLNLLTGKLVSQLDRTPTFVFEVSVDGVLCRTHGTLFEVTKQNDRDRVLCHEGSVVANVHGHVVMAKKGWVVEFVKGIFKSKYHFSVGDEADMEEWQQHLHDIRTHHPHGTTPKPNLSVK